MLQIITAVGGFIFSAELILCTYEEKRRKMLNIWVEKSFMLPDTFNRRKMLYFTCRKYTDAVLLIRIYIGGSL